MSPPKDGYITINRNSTTYFHYAGVDYVITHDDVTGTVIDSLSPYDPEVINDILLKLGTAQATVNGTSFVMYQSESRHHYAEPYDDHETFWEMLKGISPYLAAIGTLAILAGMTIWAFT